MKSKNFKTALTNIPHEVKVFTHYYPIAGSREGFRWRTLLQFGDSWEVIGSVVMKNPGSAHFLYLDERPIEHNELIERLRKFDNPDTLRDNWYEFRSDIANSGLYEARLSGDMEPPIVLAKLILFS